jgi:dienelactone hydrolase
MAASQCLWGQLSPAPDKPPPGFYAAVSHHNQKWPIALLRCLNPVQNYPMIYRYSSPSSVGIVIAALAGAPELLVAQTTRELAMPERVQFGSADGKTTLVGYVFKPSVQPGGRVPAIVMMHGRAGPYSSLAKGVYDATTLSQRHQFWGRLWAAQGYIAVLVDGFGPRGYPQGFGRFTYASRPEELDEVTIRPLDAYGALAYLRSRTDVLPGRIGLQGWSNGGSATLASMAPDAPGIAGHLPDAGFRAALAFYPACGLKDHFATIGYHSYAPLRVFVGTADEEISPRVCRELLAHAGGDVKVHFYKGATHDFDDPGRSRQSIPANAEAWRDVLQQAPAFLSSELAGN